MEPLSHSNSVVRLAWLVFGVFLSLTASAEPVHLLAESDTPTGSSELFLLSFPSLTDMINSDNLSQQTVQFSLANTFSLGGFAVDDSGYHLLAESDTPTGSSELFLLSFPSLTDMINGDNLSQQTVQFSLANTFSLGGFAVDDSG
jgi:hypothetical protein